MNFEKTNGGNTLTVELIGEVDSMNTPELEERLLKEIDGVLRVRRVVTNS